MTADTTFKEFVEEEGLTFSLLEVDSLKYRKLVERFNEVKLKLRAEEEGRVYERARLVLVLNGQHVGEDLRNLHAGS
jgi:hypothetical protein